MPAAVGAVYKPELDIDPPVAVHVTVVFVVPVTVAVNCCVPLVISDTEAGLIDTETAVTVTVAEADFVVSAELVPVTV